MGKLKKALIISAVLIIVGIVGAIPTGLIAVPKFLSDVENRVSASLKEDKMLTTVEEVPKTLVLDLEYENYYVRVFDSPDNKVHIGGYKTKSNNLKINQSYDAETKVLSVNFDINRKFFYSFDLNEGLVGTITNGIIVGSELSREIHVYLPKDIKLVIERGESAYISTQDSKLYRDKPIEYAPIYKN
ncbi:MAG: hypothetical protein RR840_04155 [Clostridium sp.]